MVQPGAEEVTGGRGGGPMDLQRRPSLERMKVTFGFGVLFSLCLLWLGARRTRRLCSEPAAACNPPDHLAEIGMNKKRAELYDRMAMDLDKHGAAFLEAGETSQSLKLSDLFRIANGRVTPVLKAANPPVRATVLYLHPDYAVQISEAVSKVLVPFFPEGIWYQDPFFYHFSLFHASHHLEPVAASDLEVEVESSNVQVLARRLCPLEIVLERVLLTSTGVLLACWQVVNGTEPQLIREELRNVLPNAPKKQLYDAVILHTSLARILGPPRLSSTEETRVGHRDEAVGLLKKLAQLINDELHNFKAELKELWFVEELDVLALALKGRMVVRKFPLECSPRD